MHKLRKIAGGGGGGRGLQGMYKCTGIDKLHFHNLPLSS